MNNPDRAKALLEATVIYCARNVPKEKKGQEFHAWPEGHFVAGSMIWMPAPREVQECCKQITQPGRSTKYKWTMLKHCCTFKHVALMFGFDERQLKKAVKAKVHKMEEFRRIVALTIILNEELKPRRKPKKEPKPKTTITSFTF